MRDRKREGRRVVQNSGTNGIWSGFRLTIINLFLISLIVTYRVKSIISPKKSASTVSRPIHIPPKAAAAGIYLLSSCTKEWFLWPLRTICWSLSCLATSLGDDPETCSVNNSWHEMSWVGSSGIGLIWIELSVVKMRCCHLSLCHHHRCHHYQLYYRHRPIERISKYQ